MKNRTDYKVKEFISSYWHYDIKNITLEKSLDDLGMYGDDKEDFINDFAKHFSLSLENFPFNHYIDDESVDVFGFGDFIKRNFLYGTKREIRLIYISMLIKWVEKGCWQYK